MVEVVLIIWFCLYSVTSQLNDIYLFLTTGHKAVLTDHIKFLVIDGGLQLFLMASIFDVPLFGSKKK